MRIAARRKEGLEHCYVILVEHVVHGILRWHLLTKGEQSYHDYVHLSLATFALSLFPIVVLCKCCTVATPVLQGSERDGGHGTINSVA